MREDWTEAFAQTARDYWGDERLQTLTGGKNLLVTPANAAVLLRALGLLHRDASMPPKEVRKFLQLNHMLRTLAPDLLAASQNAEPLRIVDAACGRAYLTVALAWCFEHVWKRPVVVVGVDRNADLVEESRRRAALAGVEHVMTFVASDLASYQWTDAADVAVVLSLHACDTATDDALAFGVRHKARLIAAAPCCQAELSRGWKTLAESQTRGAFAPVWNSPSLRRATAATVTDTFRMLLLGAAGYEARALEFVASSHTPKNTLIIARQADDVAARSLDEYVALKRATGGVGITLEGLIGVCAADQSAV
ncbi:MAG: SAM-dependent methyltransferase [bacterium]